MAARGEAQADVEVSTLVVPAWRLRWRAPELALVLGERAVALASTRRDEVDRLRAEALVVFASNRMGRGVKTADRALDALKAAEAAAQHETAWRLRVELADSARSVGAPLTGFAAVRPVLEADGVPAGLRAGALVQAAECLVSVGRGPALGRALDEADRLYQADPVLDHDTTLLHRGLLRAVAAGRHRRWGDLAAAVEACREGLSFLAGLQDPESDNGQVSGRLSVELVCALLDSGKPGEASEVGTPLLERPVRAPSATAAGWLRLALATRVHLPAGRVALARDLLRDVADSAERHQLDTLLAESLLALAHVHEVAGNLTDALTDLRSAHAAERRRARAVYAVRARLAAEFSGVHRHPAGGLHDDLIALLDAGSTATTAPPAAPADANLTPEARQQLRQWRPVQVHRNEGMRVKRSRRAAEDMTVDGISAARAHAADRWRLVQPFGTDEPDHTPSTSAPAADAQARGTQTAGTQAAEAPVGGAPGADASVAHAPGTDAPGSGTSGTGGSPAALQANAHQANAHQAAALRIDTPQTVAARTGAFPPAAPTGGAPTPAGPIPAAQASAEQPPASQPPTSQPPFGQQFASRPPGNPPQFGNAPQAEQPGGRRRAPDPPPQQPTQGRPEHARSGQAKPIAPTALSQPPIPPGGLAQGPTTPPGDRLPGPLPGMPLPVFPTPPVPPASAAFPAPPVFPPAPDVPVSLDPSAMSSAESRPRVEPESVVEKTALIPRIPAEPSPTSEPVVEAGPPGAAGEDGEGGRSVPAAGLIAAAGAMRSGRRRAREASEEEAERDAGESNVLDNLKAAGLLDPQRAGGRRRAPEVEAAEIEAAQVEAAQVEAPEAPGTPGAPGTPEAVRAVGTSEGETVKWKVEAPARLRADGPAADEPAVDEPAVDEPAADESVADEPVADEPVVDEPVLDPPVGDVDMFGSPTMVQPAIRDDVPPVGLGAAFAKGPLIPTARVPDPPDFPASAVDAFPMPPLGVDPRRDDVSVTPVPSSHEPVTGTFLTSGGTHSAAPQNSWLGAVERDGVAPSATPGGPVGADAVLESDRSVDLGHHQPQPVPVPVPVPQSEPEPVREPESDLEPRSEPDPEPLREPEPVTPPAPEPVTPPSVPEPSQVPPVPEPDQVPPVPVPEPVPPKPSPSGFLGAADVEDEGPEQPFVTSVVVGGRTIDLPAVVQPPVLESPSATRAARAARRPKGDLTLAELLAEALVAYEDARREGDGFPDDEMDEDTAPVRSPEPQPLPVEPPQAERPPVGPPPIAPPGVEPVPDNETTAPIRRLDAPRFDTWTLPES
ncbi:hypothetical protein [Saccharothrix yanglingensis]|uniref:Uncharacterized protein n=1 Tax=Saccharothrix yanglingensis TaxID=659496 RepID=A0ABU0X659_9PSEU|nr:hypothetical protein [Saccharothrix yanglingensis]MDQ2587481.1 hypothetical protein [Saccharothrix yanglingensis]